MTPFDQFREIYAKYISKKVLLMAVCAVVIFIGCGLELTFGQYKIGFVESWQLLIDHITGHVYTEGPLATQQYIIWEWRFPRMVAAMLAGAALGIAGAAMQCSMRNVMADPYITGISTGASMGVSLFVVAGLGATLGLPGMLVSAFVFSLIPVAVVLLVSSLRDTSPMEMILITVAISYVFSAVSMMLQLMATDDALGEIFYWGLGTLGTASWDNLPLIIGASLIGMAVILKMSRTMNALYLGDSTSRTLGVDANRVRIFSLVVISLMTAVMVAFLGPIGFVGLVAPHACRLVIGSENRYLYPASMLMGAAMLLISDFVARGIGTMGLPVGVITALAGGPLFLYLLIRKGSRFA